MLNEVHKSNSIVKKILKIWIWKQKIRIARSIDQSTLDLDPEPFTYRIRIDL